MVVAKNQGDKQEIMMAESHMGPLPHPSIMKQYGEIDPSYPERIMKMTEENNAASIRDNSRFLELSFKERARGQWLSFSLALIFLAVGLVALFVSNSPFAVIPMVTGIIPIGIAAVEGMVNKNK